MTDELKAPERIWATEDAKNFGEDRFHTTRPMKGLTEYVRADISADRIATLEAEVAHLRGLEQDTYDNWKKVVSDITQQRDAAMAGAVIERAAMIAEDWWYDPAKDEVTDTILADEIRALDPDASAALAEYVRPLQDEVTRLREGLRFYKDAWKFKTNKRLGGLEWSPTEELLDDCGNKARALLEGDKS